MLHYVFRKDANETGESEPNGEVAGYDAKTMSWDAKKFCRAKGN